MSVLHGFFLVTIVLGFQTNAFNVSEVFRSHGVVPDILSQPPPLLLTANYPSGAVVSGGNELSALQVATAPTVSWGAENGVFYIVIMLDPDVPSRDAPIGRSFLHWMVVNAQNNDVTTGNNIAFYISPDPPPGTAKHRYIILVYRQPAYMQIDEFAFYASFLGRPKFKPEDFAAKFHLGNPVAGNFYQTEVTSLKLI